MKMLITGATGKIGSKIIERLSSRYEIVALDRTLSVSNLSAKFHKVDLAKFTEVKEIFESESPDYVIHLAAILGPVCESNPILAKEINVDATGNLVKLAIENKVKKFVFASTSAVYDQKVLRPTKEEENINPKSVYGQSKLAAEKVIMQSATNLSTDFVILRMFNVYGKEFNDSLINKLIGSKAQAPIKVVGPENFVRDYIHIDDVVTAFELAIKTKLPNRVEIFNIASGKTTSNQELIKIVQKGHPGIRFDIQHCTQNYSWADIGRAKDYLEFSPTMQILID